MGSAQESRMSRIWRREAFFIRFDLVDFCRKINTLCGTRVCNRDHSMFNSQGCIAEGRRVDQSVIFEQGCL
jgi:hypothetical protein